MRYLSFFFKVLVMEMWVRSVGVPAAHLGLLWLERLALSRSSSLVLMFLATLLTYHQNHVLGLCTNSLRHLSFCGDYVQRLTSMDTELGYSRQTETCEELC
jgi:hypothetical protein